MNRTFSAHSADSDKTPKMNIRQAARWAEGKDALAQIVAGEPEYLYAVYDTGNHMVDVIGTRRKCKHYLDKQCGRNVYQYGQASDGRYLRMQCLEEVCQELDESGGEARCLPEACEMRELA